ncbi:MAG: S8 family serine peptidase [Anaerolineae bacterium]|nr:S8 family serine peptidase [Anaerolineae bacterium]
MKRSSVIVLSIVMALLMAACGNTTPASTATAVPPTNIVNTAAAGDSKATKPSAATTEATAEATTAATSEVAAAPTTEPTAEATTAATVAAPADATAEATSAGGDISIEPANPTPAPTLKVAGTPAPNTTINGTPVPSTQPAIKPPKSLDDLRKDYPDLGPFIDKYKDSKVGDIDMSELYKRIVEIYDAEGATGVGTFLEESGLLDKLKIPVSYLDLLREFDKGGMEAVQKLAKTRQIVNDQDEIVAYLTLDAESSLQSETDRLKGLGVTVYTYIPENTELEIGIPLAVLGQLQTPGKLLEYLSTIGDSVHIVGFRVPAPTTTGRFRLQDAVKGVAAQTVGADKWHAAGITGKGIKVGVLDLGFGKIKDYLGNGLPAKVNTLQSIDKLDRQEESHGTACAMVVHAMAPDAELYIAYFDGNSRDSFVKALQWFQKNGVQVINYSVGSAVGPRDGTFGDSPIVDAFVRDTGVLWVNAAGNYALSHTIFPFNEGKNKFHDFGEDTLTMPFIAGEPATSIAMNWNGNWNGKEKSEYDFIVLDSNGDEVASGNEPRKGRTNDYPFQFTTFEATPGDMYYLAVRRIRGTTDNNIDIFIPNGLIAPWAQVAAYSVTAPADADSALSVGATGLTKDKLEEYSSQGPTLDDRQKPDITAPTNEVIPGIYDDGFAGTSGAAPAIAGAAALVLQAFPDMDQAQVKAYLMANVVDLGDKGPDSVFGTGRLALPEPKQGSGGDNGSTGGATPEKPSNDNNTGDDGGDVGGDKSGAGEVITITDVRTKFNVKLGRDKGMQIKTTFEVDGYSGKKLLVAVLFFAPDKSELQSANEQYSINGQIGTGTVLSVKRNQTVFKDVTLFIANSAFADVTEDSFFFIVGAIDVTDQNNPVLVAKSDPIEVTKK